MEDHGKRIILEKAVKFHAKGAKHAKAERHAKDWIENLSPRWWVR